MQDIRTQDFLTAIWGNGPHSICWMDPERAFTFAIISDPDAILRHLPDLQSVDVWISAHPLKGPPQRGRGDRDDVLHVIALPADLDWQHPTRRTDDPLPTEAETRARLTKLGPDLQPSIVINSGHGLQPWWLLTTAVDLDTAEQLIDQLDSALLRVGLTNGRSDLPSILRLPGTNNMKDPDDPRPVRIEIIEPQRKYTPEYLAKHLPQPTGTGIHKGGTRHRTGSVTSDQQALTNHIVTTHRGHSIDVWRDGSVHIVRPGKPAKDGSSASIITGEDGDAILTVFSDHWPNLAPGSYILGADGQLTHPSNVMATITVNMPQPADQVVDYQLPTLPIDWRAFAKRDPAQRRWLVENFWPWGRAMSLWADAKEGKSETVLWCVAKLAMGVHPWTGDPIEPVRIAYFDWEMTEDDLDDRLSDLDIDPLDLENLHYFLLPTLYPLDDDKGRGGEQIVKLMRHYGDVAAVIDTFGRSVAGEEDRADTVRNFYRYTAIRLKQEGLAYLRLDHAGKDSKRGTRGSSAKRDDVDLVWYQKRTPTGTLLTCTHTRLGWVNHKLTIDRDVDPKTKLISYSAPVTVGWPDGTLEKAKELDTAGVPLDAGRPKTIELLKAAGFRQGNNEILAAALKYRRLPSPRYPQTGQIASGTAPGTAPDLSPGDSSGDSPEQDDHLDLFTTSDQDISPGTVPGDS